MRVAILTISDSVARGTRDDRSGHAIAERCRELGWEVVSHAVLADERDMIAARLIQLADSNAADLILTVGGTGLGPRDVTPEATEQAAERLVPGLGERMRAAGASSNAHAILSRSIAACRGRSLILNLPGSPRGAVESFAVVEDVILHAIEILHGAGHDPAPLSGKAQS
jgi:molybdenum cofactor synthesis domain-containing protein